LRERIPSGFIIWSPLRIVSLRGKETSSGRRVSSGRGKCFIWGIKVFNLENNTVVSLGCGMKNTKKKWF
jgi:hypothetical protein